MLSSLSLNTSQFYKLRRFLKEIWEERMSKNIPGRRLPGAKTSTIRQEVEKANGIRVFHRCGGCGKKQEFLNSGKFRVNANGNKVDVWLIYRCKKCKHS